MPTKLINMELVTRRADKTNMQEIAITVVLKTVVLINGDKKFLEDV